MRWKALQFLGKLESADISTRGFKPQHCPSVDERTNFENDLMLMIINVQFKRFNDSFKKKIKNS